MDRIVGMGEYAISNNVNDILKTFALGSCVAITIYSPLNSIAGMAHIVLPSFERSKNSDNKRPCYYANTGVPFLINEMCSLYGCLKNELKIELYGGAKSLRSNDVFKIGQRNVETVKKMLAELNIVYNAKETGGTYSRTIQMDVVTGKTRMISYPIII